ncbi:helix-turn-helix domain-containing protein [Gellertiella hungarica]|uniref:Transcriptional regulator with XRE-family HTH domain n=1 Tax=Gellertiella hungarica TaxID=1572859 RepID=A0A7W6J7V4_9HYPH|nr:XRE family transcriptional regulator [Gellertiella hungarica]MBB4066421.1 transcriptional regulator with XRE-family HTH domain [Gellertiella hungarica]
MEEFAARRLRALRAESGMTLEALAEASGVSRAMISRIERGEASPTAVLLARLCAALGQSLSSFFAEEEASSPLQRREEQHVWQDPETGYVRRAVSPPGTASPVDLVDVTLPPGKAVRFPPQASSAGIMQHVWVLDGRLELSVADAVFTLEEGDCLYHEIGRGHVFQNIGGKPVRYMVALEHGRRRQKGM